MKQVLFVWGFFCLFFFKWRKRGRLRAACRQLYRNKLSRKKKKKKVKESIQVYNSSNLPGGRSKWRLFSVIPANISLFFHPRFSECTATKKSAPHALSLPLFASARMQLAVWRGEASYVLPGVRDSANPTVVMMADQRFTPLRLSAVFQCVRLGGKVKKKKIEGGEGWGEKIKGGRVEKRWREISERCAEF